MVSYILPAQNAEEEDRHTMSICGTRKSHARMTQSCTPRTVNWTGQIIQPSNERQENKVALSSVHLGSTVSRLFSEAVSKLMLCSIERENMVRWKWMRNLLGAPAENHGHSHVDICEQKKDVIERRSLLVSNLASSSG